MNTAELGWGAGKGVGAVGDWSGGRGLPEDCVGKVMPPVQRRWRRREQGMRYER